MVKMDVETFIVEHRRQNVSLESQITACSTELEFATGLFYLSAVSRKMRNNQPILRTLNNLKWGPFNYRHMHSALNVDLSLFASDG